MTALIGEPGIVVLILSAAMGLFIWNRWRYDVVAVMALVAGLAAGIVPIERAFAGFGHPAVITVAAVLMMSQALQRSGIVDHLAKGIASLGRSAWTETVLTAYVAAGLSAFMNNVGALALMLPVAVRNAERRGTSPSLVLMPLAFASLLGGLVTLIGTPPNIVIASARAQVNGEPFAMFDFTMAGLPVALAGLAFITLFGPKLLPMRSRRAPIGDRFRLSAYLIEARVLGSSPLIGATISQLEDLCDNEATVMSIVRDSERHLAPDGAARLAADDVLILQGDPLALRPLLEQRGLISVGDADVNQAALMSDDVILVEAMVMPKAPIEGRSMRRLRMHETYGVNLLAMARKGKPPAARLARISFQIGDILLLQGHRSTMRKILPTLGCLPLAERGFNMPKAKTSWLPLAIFALAVLAAALGLAPVQIAFVSAVLAMVLTGAIATRDAYSSIEWPVIVLLACLIPIGEALETTGATGLIAGGIASVAGDLPLWALLALIMATSMLLSDLVHNTPTAVLMAPIGLSLAATLQVSPDALLMAIAIGAASPYLTPIGHQSNTLVMGPGGYQFGDYWRLGLPMDLVILATAVPMIMLVWA
ncbi:MAG: SLC13 family permease [Alphaproteobacteria bacterium]|nr:SLC13 family permease [Alphaproteobacteria bacterium]